MTATRPVSQKPWNRPAVLAVVLGSAALLFVLAVVFWGYFSKPDRTGLGIGTTNRFDGTPADGVRAEPAVQGVGRYIVRAGKHVTLEHAGHTWIRIGPHRLRNAVVGDLYATREDPDLRLIELHETDSASRRRLRLERYDEVHDWVEVSAAEK